MDIRKPACISHLSTTKMETIPIQIATAKMAPSLAVLAEKNGGCPSVYATKNGHLRKGKKMQPKDSQTTNYDDPDDPNSEINYTPWVTRIIAASMSDESGKFQRVKEILFEFEDHALHVKGKYL